MYLLKKVIQLRENSHPDHEKPFLEHLEDLRTTITRVVVTLVISMIICFAFNKNLM
jgi:Sec-independent protein secretion pathway component TatC